MEAAQFLETAESLADGNRESDWRSSISRAYYSSYNTACKLIREGVDEGRLRRSGWGKRIPHEWLRQAFAGASDQKVRVAGRMLGSLYEDRVIADYHLLETVDKAQAEEACDDARLLNTEMEALGPDRIAQSVRESIDRHS